MPGRDVSSCAEYIHVVVVEAARIHWVAEETGSETMIPNRQQRRDVRLIIQLGAKVCSLGGLRLLPATGINDSPGTLVRQCGAYRHLWFSSKLCPGVISGR